MLENLKRNEKIIIIIGISLVINIYIFSNILYSWIVSESPAWIKVFVFCIYTILPLPITVYFLVTLYELFSKVKYIIHNFKIVVMKWFSKLIIVYKYLHSGWKRLLVAIWVLVSFIPSIVIGMDSSNVMEFTVLFLITFIFATAFYWVVVLLIFWIRDGFKTDKDNSSAIYKNSIAIVNKLVLSINDTVTDIDGNTYKIVKIGKQIWMTENLKVTHYRNGDEIPNITNNSEWASLSTGAYGIYNNDPANSEVYGNLYNWYAVDDTRDICPDGWHVPTGAEWTELTDYLGGTTVAGGKMKSTGTIENRDGSNTGATNERGFTALPGGYRYYSSGSYFDMGYLGYFWSSTEFNINHAWYRSLNYHSSDVYRIDNDKKSGFSVRLVRD